MAELQRPPDGHTSDGATEVILRDARDGKPPLGGGDCELLRLGGEEAFAEGA